MTTPNTTSLLILAIERFPAGSPIRGKLWLDDFELSPESAADDSSDDSNKTSKNNSPSNSNPKENP